MPMRAQKRARFRHAPVPRGGASACSCRQRSRLSPAMNCIAYQW
jgi:hypothetical protein